MSRNGRNNFLLHLLHLQQDGKDAISAPANWSSEPLLQVETEIDADIEDLARTILGGKDGNGTGRWHFFIGSPGNGKSAAMGKLCRILKSKECKIEEIYEDAQVPYTLNVYEKDEKYLSARIIQDASVVKNPFSPGSDPADELLGEVKEAWEKGISLIICTNRGVLEKAYRDHHMEKEYNTKPWFKEIKKLANPSNSRQGALPSEDGFKVGTASKHPPFEEVKISHTHLDNRSLLLGKDTFDNLLKNATKPEHWEVCTSCAAKAMCPFKTNRDWLADNDARSKVLEIFKKAEVFSGQIIVFREALAIISLILSGCPRDYDNDKHPCEWVQDALAESDIFKLAMRRIYMCLFSSYSQYGMEPARHLQERQRNALKELRKEMKKIRDKKIPRAIMHVIDKVSPPSTDTGVTRLLGAGGIMSEIDACRDAMPVEFYERWDADYEAYKGMSREWKVSEKLFTQVEKKCISAWKDLEELLEMLTKHTVLEAHWALRRWSSNFLLHFGALHDGCSAWREELEEFTELLALVNSPEESRTYKQHEKMEEWNGQLKTLLNASSGQQEENLVRLSEAVTLSGRWVLENLNPAITTSKESGNVSLVVKFRGGEHKEEYAAVSALTYLWLYRHTRGKLDIQCFPSELLSGTKEAQVRAASKSEYAFANDGVVLEIDTGQNTKFILKRLGGEVGLKETTGE